MSISISEDITVEIAQVLAYPKLEKIYRTTVLHKEDLIEQIIKIAKFVKVIDKVEVINEHPADNKFLECALAANADYIVSGDKHVLRVATYKKIKMLSVSDFLNMLK